MWNMVIKPPSPGPLPQNEGRGAKESEIGTKSPSLLTGRVDTDLRGGVKATRIQRVRHLPAQAGVQSTLRCATTSAANPHEESA